ncbi:hypothetical protein D6D17_01469 [Aureobasidium pullulans]|uniref:Tho complex subunit 7/Mft1p n=1 Tax=Aureobasidium pullulans TaxID=5580 RepID=A0A4S8XHP7_AURPU|nr:hypothetical protein D6D24_01983 [Aureobasidium pullulans]THW39562.1 hypothetical protein D6D22_06256 [Aureobasidium pullulans]THX19247.1 hypothetical protein D6D17_01469 [Aureobasidium pullulans]THZ30341.1 hypothetical protein D6C89_01501 [Aureobasidium pullulans]TIA36984.1 hypothetical protein D6C83_06580 [Aureobasidium pullulans]
MSGHPFGLLEQADEDALHTARLLNVEERPFARVTKRLLGKDSLLRSPAQLPTPPPDDSGADQDAERQKQEQERRQWREDVMVDFALLESAFIRIQFLKDSNEKERQRYANEKTKILDTAQAVRDNTAELRIQLEEAQKTLTLRKEYDVLAEKITGNRMLKPREEQRASLEKLNAEISDLEHEGQEYEQTWIERKEQFDNIMAAGKQMLRVIRGEKDEPEKDEIMEDGEEREDGEATKENSRMGTPGPEMGGEDDDPSNPKRSRGASQATGANTPAAGATSQTPDLGDTVPAPGEKPLDTDMMEAGETPQPAPVTELEEGEAAEDSAEEGEHMDVT